jgi:dTDP-glucose pyrophosphorylase
MWGIVPAAGAGSRIQPLAFSKELLPVGSRRDEDVDRPRAVSEYLVERMLHAGATRICFVISQGKSDIVEYYGGSYALKGAIGARSTAAELCYVVQPAPTGLCDAIFRALPLIGSEENVLVGLPDTVWFPVDGFALMPDDTLAFLLFPVERPERFDAVLADEDGHVREIRVKREDPGTNWIWGAFRMPGKVLHELHALFVERDGRDEYFGTLVNAYLARGGRARAIKRGEKYVDVGTLHGYREGIRLLGELVDASSIGERER